MKRANINTKSLQLKIEFSTHCNLRCLMCRQNHNKNTSLDIEVLKKNIPWDHIGTILIQGGEFLILKNARDFFDYLVARNIRPILTTNGTVMNSLWAKKIALHAFAINFSLNAATKETHEKINVGSKWEKVLKNIEMVISYRDRLRTGLYVGGHMTIVPQNLFEIPLFIKNHKKIGFDSIDFSIDFATVPAFLKRYPHLKNRLKAAIKKTLASMKQIRMTTDTLKAFGLY
jgi:MoaA/NifB/PqqE/SkfB family radical SAM enzyme